jgi:hypothetical protein
MWHRRALVWLGLGPHGGTIEAPGSEREVGSHRTRPAWKAPTPLASASRTWTTQGRGPGAGTGRTSGRRWPTRLPAPRDLPDRSPPAIQGGADGVHLQPRGELHGEVVRGDLHVPSRRQFVGEGGVGPAAGESPPGGLLAGDEQDVGLVVREPGVFSSDRLDQRDSWPRPPGPDQLVGTKPFLEVPAGLPGPAGRRAAPRREELDVGDLRRRTGLGAGQGPGRQRGDEGEPDRREKFQFRSEKAEIPFRKTEARPLARRRSRPITRRGSRGRTPRSVPGNMG